MIRKWFGITARRGEFFDGHGHCAVCAAPAHFVARDSWLRDNLRCQSCGSIPRERALMTVLEQRYPDWRALAMHESSPGLPSSKKLERECKAYLSTHFFPDIAPGEFKFGVRCENLESQTFPDESFDLVVTQDVMEHVLDPEAAFRDIARTLRSGGAHVFTTPVYKGLARSIVYARRGGAGIEYLVQPPEYHGNPIDEKGALVTMHYGADIGELIFRWSGLATTVYVIRDPALGLAGEFLEVMVTVKPARTAA